MLATVEHGRLIRVNGNPDNPFTRGNLCRKVAHYEERVYSPDRVLYPMRRVGRKGQGAFERISWDEALAEIAGRWKRIIHESGPEAIQPYSYAGTMGIVQMNACDSRLWYRMGAGQLKRTICSSAAEVGYGYVNGRTGGIDPEEFAESKFIIAWGTNLSSTNVHQMPFVRQAQARGATFVVIDPYRTRTANAADWFVQPLPGTDAALALGMAHTIFAEGLHDEPFLEAHAIGWREFRDRCAQYPPERVAEITGVAVDEILRLARAYATTRPAAIRLGYGISRTSNGGGMVRAIACLPAVIGAWGKRGDGLLLSTSAHFPINWRRVKRPDLVHSPDDESDVKWGRRVPRAINMNEIGKALLTTTNPPIRSLYVYNSNPAAVAPNSSLVIEGLLREDLFTVVHEQMLNDTARFADILLPATTQMEHWDLMRAYGHLYVNLCAPAIEPLGEARPNLDVLNSLALAMGYTDDLFHDTAETVIRDALDSPQLREAGVTYEYLLEHGFARIPSYTPGVVPAFATLSGKIELYSKQAEKDGYDALPEHVPPTDPGADGAEGRSRFPINLLSPAAHHFLNSTFSNLPTLQHGEKEPRIWIHAVDARQRGVADGDWLRVWNSRGAVRLRAVVSENVKPGVAWSPSLWWHRDSPGGNVNVLTSDRLADMGGGSTFHTNFVDFARCNGTDEGTNDAAATAKSSER